jgi:hypothetical protein
MDNNKFDKEIDSIQKAFSDSPLLPEPDFKSNLQKNILNEYFMNRKQIYIRRLAFPFMAVCLLFFITILSTNQFKQEVIEDSKPLTASTKAHIFENIALKNQPILREQIESSVVEIDIFTSEKIVSTALNSFDTEKIEENKLLSRVIERIDGQRHLECIIEPLIYKVTNVAFVDESGIELRKTTAFNKNNEIEMIISSKKHKNSDNIEIHLFRKDSDSIQKFNFAKDKMTPPTSYPISFPILKDNNEVNITKTITDNVSIQNLELGNHRLYSLERTSTIKCNDEDIEIIIRSLVYRDSFEIFRTEVFVDSIAENNLLYQLENSSSTRVIDAEEVKNIFEISSHIAVEETTYNNDLFKVLGIISYPVTY